MTLAQFDVLWIRYCTVQNIKVKTISGVTSVMVNWLQNRGTDGPGFNLKVHNGHNFV